MICDEYRFCSLPLFCVVLHSPATTLMRLSPARQWAAVSTHSGVMSIPPHQGLRPGPLLRPTCHFHAHSGAVSPFTMASTGTIAQTDLPLPCTLRSSLAIHNGHTHIATGCPLDATILDARIPPLRNTSCVTSAEKHHRQQCGAHHDGGERISREFCKKKKLAFGSEP